jgi:uncharacterized protein YbaR (Trm112 family)
MSVNAELLEILVCPETRQPVALADAAVLARLNAEVDAGRLRNRGGDKVSKRIDEGLLRQDGKVLYICRRRHPGDADRGIDRAVA